MICRELDLADGTVRTHIQDVFRILNVHNRTPGSVRGEPSQAASAGRRL